MGIEENSNYLVGGSYRGVLVHNSPEVVTGGNALKYYASMRIDIRKQLSQKILSGDELIGNKVTIKIVKKRLSIFLPPFSL